jgi:hypothetical protein
MRSIANRITTLAFAVLALTLAAGGCADIGEAIDCEQMCSQLQVCIDSDLDVERCAERCEDKADNNTLRRKLDDCTDCLDHEYACAEIPDRCSACQEVADALL